MHKDFLQAIKKDDVTKFQKLLEIKRGLLSLSYGRFPILSLCYLYNSKKIIKQFEKELLGVRNYNIIDEDLESYRLFKNKAKKTLRFFIDKVVTPFEMLAILGESLHIVALAEKNEIDENTLERLTKIFNILHNQKVEKTQKSIDGYSPKQPRENYNLKISRKKLTRKQKIYAIITLAAVVFVMLFSGGIWYGYQEVFGNGSIKSPYRIAGENQLIEIMSRGEGNFYLAKDITLTKEWEINNFSGKIDGKNHTIYAGDNIKTSFIDELDGNIQNLNIDADYEDVEITEHMGVLARINNGEIKDVGIDISGSFIASSQEERLFFSCLVLQNEGDIFDISINADVSIENQGGKDVYLTGVASINNANIEKAATSKTSNFWGDTVDVSGLVTENYSQMKECVNNAQVKQITASENWYPHASGVVMINYGEIMECQNNGQITVEANAIENRNEAYVGGIAAINRNKIIKSKNQADIIGKSKEPYIYAGGVVGYNIGLVNNSSSYLKISVSSTDEENFLFAGGIAGYSEGVLKDCFSLSEFESENTKAYMGGIVGVMHYLTAKEEYYQNNFYLSRANISFGQGTLVKTQLDGRRIINENGEDIGVTAVGSLDEMKDKEVYWE